MKSVTPAPAPALPGRAAGRSYAGAVHDAPPLTSFASDNYAPAHPEVMAAVVAANSGHARAYGADPWTDALRERARELFGERATIHPVFNGTGANVLSLMAMTRRWNGVVTSRWAHVNTDENGAPERVGGLKLLTVDAPDGRLTPAAVARYAGDLGDVHRAQPTVLSLTQCTELGTVYGVEELRALADAAHAHGMHVHLDGSRLANAAAHLGTDLRAITTDVGVDVLSLGGTKNGALLGEAVVVIEPEATGDAARYLQKSTMQLASKMRFVSAQLLALLGEPGDDDPLWRRNAAHANAMAARLRAAVEGLVEVTQPTEANAVFAVVPRAAADAVRARYPFYDWSATADPERVEVRWMCAWDTTPEDVDAFAAALADALGGA